MDYEALVLNKLLDKYEERAAGSNRRVRIVCEKREIAVPDMESNEYQDFRKDMLSLKNKGYIELDWIRKDYIIDSIWLNLDNAEMAYRYLERENRMMKINAVVKLIDEAIRETDAGWIHDYLESARYNMKNSSKLIGIWRSEHKLLGDFLTALIYIDRLKGKTVSMRAFSVKTYGDSKKFERDIKQYIVSVIKDNEPDLSDVEDISDREALAQVGVIMMPEIFEFCGNVRIEFADGTVDFSPLSKGACISSECISDICSVEIFQTDRIVFIENKTNFAEYCLNSKSENELVIYHGGFFSPQRGEFFRKLCKDADVPVYFWGDIDYGGFRMFVRLKNNIINSLQPLNMDIDSYNRYKGSGLKKNDNYIAKLMTLTDDPDYSIFSEVIAAVAKEKTTVEQESFLDRELVMV